MGPERRKFGLAIWALGLGYFVFYTPYSGLTKALTSGLIPQIGSISGFELLPLSAVATVAGMLGFISVMGWWKYAGRRQVLALSLPFPTIWTFLSGLCMATIIGTTTLAFSFSGASIVFVLILLRGGVLIIGPVVDALARRRVRWFSWAAMIVSLLALAVALEDVENYKLKLAAVADVTAYLTAYFVRFRIMSRFAKSNDSAVTMRYFVEEQLVATPALVAVLGILALAGTGGMMMEFRRGFTTFLATNGAGPAIVVGIFYAALCVCTTFIFLDRRENTFCIPMHCGTSMLSGIAASAILTAIYDQRATSGAQLASAGLIVVALAFLSPLHHVKDRLAAALARNRALLLKGGLATRTGVLPDAAGREAGYIGRLKRVFLFVCSGNTCRSPMAEAIGNAELARRLGISLDSFHTAPVQSISAGVTAKPGAPMTSEAVMALQALQVPVRPHASRPLTVELVDSAEVVYCMSQSHRDAVLDILPSAAAKTHCLDPNGDLEDPLGGGPDVYMRCARRIQALVRLRLDEAGFAGAALAGASD